MRLPKPKPCPCCGGTELYQGHFEATVLGVGCRGCGLRMERVLPDRWPRGYATRYKGRMGAAIKALERLTLKQAIEAWNKRS